MIDPIFLTDFNRNKEQLEELLIFSVLVAGKNALTTANLTEILLQVAHKIQKLSFFSPFECLRKFSQKELAILLKTCKIGCHSRKTEYLEELINASLDVFHCSLEELVNIKGIGFKTANMFLMHSRQDYKGCCLDVHMLRYLQDMGYKVPKITPQSKKKYLEIQEIYLSLAKSQNVDPTVLDLQVWRKYSKNG